jgi:hypothetical protein
MLVVPGWRAPRGGPSGAGGSLYTVRTGGSLLAHTTPRYALLTLFLVDCRLIWSGIRAELLKTRALVSHGGVTPLVTGKNSRYNDESTRVIGKNVTFRLKNRLVGIAYQKTCLVIPVRARICRVMRGLKHPYRT